MSYRPEATELGGPWGAGTVPVDEYLRFVGADLEGPADSRRLVELHRRHLETFAFEAVDPFLGRVPSLAPGEVYGKLARERRCGYCFEQNMLFAAVLESIGFGVRRLGGRMRLGSPRPRGKHMALAVEASDGRWLADVGFGADGLIEPVPWADGTEVVQDGWRFHFGRAVDDEWVLTAWLPGVGWFDLYSVGEQPLPHVDFEITNYFIGSHPHSPFTSHLVAQYREAGAKLLLRDRTLTEIGPDGTRTETAVESGELGSLLARRFGLALTEPVLAELDERLARGEAPAAGSPGSWAGPMHHRDPAERRGPRSTTTIDDGRQ